MLIDCVFDVPSVSVAVNTTGPSKLDVGVPDSTPVVEFSDNPYVAKSKEDAYVIDNPDVAVALTWNASVTRGRDTVKVGAEGTCVNDTVSGPMTMVRDVVFDLEFAFVAVNVALYEPATVGVPVSHHRVGNVDELDMRVKPLGRPVGTKLLILPVLGK